MRSSGIGRSGLFRLGCVKLGTHFAEQTLSALGEGFAKLPLAHGLVKVESAALKCQHGLNELISSLYLRHLCDGFAFLVGQAGCGGGFVGHCYSFVTVVTSDTITPCFNVMVSWSPVFTAFASSITWPSAPCTTA